MANNPVIRKIKIADVVYDLKDGSVEEQINAALSNLEENLDIDHPVYVAEESVDTSAEVINADTLGGHPADDFATKVYVDDKISEVQVGGDGLTTEDVQDMIDTSLEGFEGGASSWNDLTDKPFYEEGSGATITWDGNTEGLESSNSFQGVTSYHVSDLTPSIDELIGGNLAFSDGQSLEVAEDWIITLSDDVIMIGELSVFVAYKENATFTNSNTTVVFPKQGVYFTKGNDGVFYTSSLIYGSSIIKTLDEKFIPDTIARITDIEYALEDAIEDAMDVVGNLSDLATTKKFNTVAAINEVYNKVDSMLYTSSTSYSVECNGDKTGREVFLSDYYRFADIVDDCRGIQIISGTWSNGNSLGTASDLITNGEGYIQYSSHILFITDSTVTFSGTTYYNITPGIYFNLSNAVYPTYVYYSVNRDYIDEKCIPDTIARVSDLGEIGSGLPEVTTGNNGQILGVSNGAWTVMSAPSGLPAVSASNNGQLLGVNNGTWVAMDAPSGLPEATTDLEGAFLRIVNGVPTWVLIENAEDGEY